MTVKLAPVEIGGVEEFEEGQPRKVSIGNRDVVVVRWGGGFYALSAVCPHQLGPMDEGFVRASIGCPGRVGDVEADHDTPVLTCPWHGWEFRLRDGRPTWNPGGPSLRTFRVRVREGRLLIELR